MINDMSTDNTSDILFQEVGKDPRFTIIDNKVKKYVLRNICAAIELSNPDDENIIVMLDGDDWFARKDVLTILNKIYEEKECLLTYGSYVEYPSAIKGKFAREVPHHIVDNNLFRESEWMTSHLRTWKYKLWKNIDQERSFTEPAATQENNHFANCWDLAYMFPLLELAGKRGSYIPDVLYVYNRQNPLNVDKLDNNLQLYMEQKIRNMEKYQPLDNI